MVNNEMLALVMQWLLIQTQYMMSSLTLGIRAPAAIPRASNITPRMDRRIGGYNTLKKFLIIYCLINTCIYHRYTDRYKYRLERIAALSYFTKSTHPILTAIMSTPTMMMHDNIWACCLIGQWVGGVTARDWYREVV